MLIDLAPEPGSGRPVARDAGARAPESPADPAGFFGAVFARLVRATQRGSDPAPAPEAQPPEARSPEPAESDAGAGAADDAPETVATTPRNATGRAPESGASNAFPGMDAPAADPAGRPADSTPEANSATTQGRRVPGSGAPDATSGEAFVAESAAHRADTALETVPAAPDARVRVADSQPTGGTGDREAAGAPAARSAPVDRLPGPAIRGAADRASPAQPHAESAAARPSAVPAFAQVAPGAAELVPGQPRDAPPAAVSAQGGRQSVAPPPAAGGVAAPEPARAQVAAASPAIAPPPPVADGRLAGAAEADPSASRADPPAWDRAPLKPTHPTATDPARTAAERMAFAPTLSENVLTARMDDARLSGLRMSDALSPRGLEALAAVSALGAGEGSIPTAPAETTSDRFLRAAPGAAAELARDIAQQIGARITPLARGQFELMLAPAELGRLEIAMREIDGVMTLSVSADRPETLELIRRHVELLAQELRQITQRELSLQLGTGGDGRTAFSQNEPPRIVRADAAAADTPAQTGPRTAIAPDHLDLRL